MDSYSSNTTPPQGLGVSPRPKKHILLYLAIACILLVAIAVMVLKNQPKPLSQEEKEAQYRERITSGLKSVPVTPLSDTERASITKNLASPPPTKVLPGSKTSSSVTTH